MSETEPEIRVEHRESLAQLLDEAAEIEHGLMCCYLYAAFSIGEREQAKYPRHAEAMARWRATILEVAREEMVHLALVSNLLNAIGASPHFARSNFPVAPGYHPAGVVVSLAPFCAGTIDHFVYLERPEGMELPDGEGFAPVRQYKRGARAGRLVSNAQDYNTVGHLYRGIEDGFRALAESLGSALFCGDPRLQLGSETLGLAGITPVTDLDSAVAAIERIVEQGEGATDAHHLSHYCRFLAIKDELAAARAADPDFAPAATVARNPVMRRPPSPEGLLWVDEEPAASVLDVANSLYALTVRSLAVLFSPVALAPGARSLSTEMMALCMRTLTPIAELLTTLPASTDAQRAGITAGLTFTVSRPLLLPEPRGAFRTLFEGIHACADAVRTRIAPLDERLAPFADRLDALGRRLQEMSEVAPIPAFDGAAPKVRLPLHPPAAYVGGDIEEARGQHAVLRFEGKRCIHARHCVLGAPRVFLANTKGAWLFPDEVTVEKLVHIAETCPSGAITYERLDGGPAEEAPPVNSIRIRENGPYAVYADAQIGERGHVLRAVLCRCGASANKPFCDGSHNAIHFQATGEPATRESKPLEERGGPVQFYPTPDGPLAVSGPLEICTGTGRTVDRITGARLCRCGGSATKPFCDGTHAKIGFRAE